MHGGGGRQHSLGRDPSHIRLGAFRLVKKEIVCSRIRSTPANSCHLFHPGIQLQLRRWKSQFKSDAEITKKQEASPKRHGSSFLREAVCCKAPRVRWTPLHSTYVASLLQALSRPSCSLQMSAMGFWAAQLIVIGPYCVLAACFKRQPCTLVDFWVALR
jgi:hypothetical protein